MRDRRPVHELSIEELERILAIRKREQRQARLRQYQAEGRRLPDRSPVDIPPPPDPPVEPQQHEAARDVAPLDPPVTYDITDDIPRFEDELEDMQRARQPRRETHRQKHKDTPHPPRERQLWDKLLLAIEVVGVAGIVIVLIYGGYLILNENDKIEALEEKSAQIQRDAAALRPTPTPRPELRVQLADYVLPGGHTITDDGLGQFNLDELPESIRGAARVQINAAPRAQIVERAPNGPISIQIPAIEINASVFEGDDWFTLQSGVGHYPASANPGEDANMVLTAHNDIYGELFRHLDQLQPGDEINVEADNGQWYTYVVENTDIVDPTDVWVLNPGNEPIVTLISCYPYRVDSQRIVVFGRLVGPRGGA